VVSVLPSREVHVLCPVLSTGKDDCEFASDIHLVRWRRSQEAVPYPHGCHLLPGSFMWSIGNVMSSPRHSTRIVRHFKAQIPTSGSIWATLRDQCSVSRSVAITSILWILLISSGYCLNSLLRDMTPASSQSVSSSKFKNNDLTGILPPGW